ncbi:hypothetical protein [Halorussus lipolyticus]|uniref:hypothetical protein n=1 Tax=Halorussus lipolyticus TaxID=3034024 RepID=UPI0023E8DA83|nr:hypothetical protein [Halorussus sp. DT80]
MQLGYWLDESYFPLPEDDERSYQYAERVYDSIKNRYHRERGGKLKPLLKKTGEHYSEVYAFAKTNGKLVLTHDDITFFIGDENTSTAVVENGADRITSQLTRAGWLYANPDYCFSGSPFEDAEAVYVYRCDANDDGQPLIHDLGAVLTTAGQETVVSNTALEDYLEERFQQLARVEEVTSERVTAYRLAIETGLNDREWVAITAQNTDLRLWIDFDEAYTKLMDRFEGQTEISKADLESELYSFVGEHTSHVEQDATLLFGDFVDAFYRRLRSRSWGEIEHENETTWYRTEEAHRKALKEYVDEYGEILENPQESPMDADATREEVYSFFNINQSQFTRHGIYTSGFLDDKLRMLDWMSETDETLKEMDGAETADGTWELPFEFESEQSNGESATNEDEG